MISLREEFVRLALQPGANRRDLCRRFGISADTGYRLLARYQEEGLAGLADRPRRPKHSPRQTGPALEAAVLTLRAQHPTWGGRKLAARLRPPPGRRRGAAACRTLVRARREGRACSVSSYRVHNRSALRLQRTVTCAPIIDAHRGRLIGQELAFR